MDKENQIIQIIDNKFNNIINQLNLYRNQSNPTKCLTIPNTIYLLNKLENLIINDIQNINE